MREGAPTLGRIVLSALAALLVGLGAVSLISGVSDTFPLNLLEGLAVFGAGAVILGGVVVLVLVRLAGWRDPESEADFDALVECTEWLAQADSWGDSEEYETDDSERELASDEDDGLFDPYDEDDFGALVRSAMDELPLEFHLALEHVAVVVSDGGRRRRAYGMYEGDTVARDHFHDRILIFRDTLLRDFGHDPDLLKAQVVRVVRHELAHHLGWDEKGVRGLGL